MEIKIGDMVVILRVWKESSGYEGGLREGYIGTVMSVGHGLEPQGQIVPSCDVEFPIGLCRCPTSDLRRIPPPERGDWNDCWYTPPHLKECERLRRQYA